MTAMAKKQKYCSNMIEFILKHFEFEDTRGKESATFQREGEIVENKEKERKHLDEYGEVKQ